MNDNSKKCSKCKKIKPLTTEYWHRDRKQPTGFTSACKTCCYTPVEKEVLPDGQKRCFKCKCVLSLDHFHKCKSNTDGLSGYCKDCKSRYSRKRYKESRLTDRMTQRATSANRLAAEFEVEGTITRDDVVRLFETGDYKCSYCGIELSFEGISSDCATIEHKIPMSRGGSNTVENLTISCLGCNSAKRSMTAQEFKMARTWITNA